ncbi:Fc.00g072990.m01.CDS01 [Cosmosporella sp. VM-42]
MLIIPDSRNTSEPPGDMPPNAGSDVTRDGLAEGTTKKDEEEVHHDHDVQTRPVHSVFPPSVRMFIVLLTVFATFFSPFSSFPLSPQSRKIIIVLLAIAPLFFDDLSDQIGRRPVYMLTFAIYLGANIGLALQNNYVALMVLRAMQSTGSSATVAIGTAVMADVTTSAERGRYITAVQASVQFAPALAPVLGGISTEFLGWRSTFWFLTIAAGVFLAIYVPFCPESARNIVGNGSIPPPFLNASLTTIYQRRQKHPDLELRVEDSTQPPPNQKGWGKIPIPNVWAAITIAFEKDIGPLMLFMSLFFMANYMMLVPLQDVIRRKYNFNDLQVGLCYIPFAMGAVLGSVISGKMLNWNYEQVARSIGVSPDRKKGDDLRTFPIERARLGLIWPWTILTVAMILPWGWIVDSGTSLAAPLVVLL